MLDTTTERLLAGLRTDQDQALNLDARGQHAGDVVPAVQTLLNGRRPDAIGVALGPGSFTGTRIGLATAKGLAEGWDCPLFGLGNLEAMASAWRRLEPVSPAAVLPAIDARKRKVYGLLQHAGTALLQPADLSPAEWLAAVRRVWDGPVVVSGPQPEALLASLGGPWPEGWTALTLRDWVTPLLDQLEAAVALGPALPPEAGPRYLRRSEAEEGLSGPA